ncbi:type II secretion system protein GspG [Paucibacter sp. R3-3]|uniref:Type II secretion system protein GspG n=1 Tax=Roseateles agri TaxID=3098619 RepID=A0ABU5DAQ3_9BURK|nr:type II secretion system protein GspG [Paucibacter sp. R3-3]MDY0743351.1 type II secretion system protein GspG [Paucibacter sp. R3-3]
MRRAASRYSGGGFTVIELLVVLAALALLLSIAAPRYIQHLDKAREVTLKQDLRQMRDAIDKFYNDQGRYPETLNELVERSYLRGIPTDPVTDRADSWVAVPPSKASQQDKGVFDVHSGATDKASDGSSYGSW